MTRRSLTSKPAVPALVRAAAIGALAWTPLACGDDGGGNSNSSDQFPTDPCSHSSSPPPECNSGTGVDSSATGMETSAEDTFDSAPTTPCAHDPGSCSTGVDLSTGGTTAATDTDTDTDTDADTGSTGSTGGTSTGAG